MSEKKKKGKGGCLKFLLWCGGGFVFLIAAIVVYSEIDFKNKARKCNSAGEKECKKLVEWYGDRLRTSEEDKALITNPVFPSIYEKYKSDWDSEQAQKEAEEAKQKAEEAMKKAEEEKKKEEAEAKKEARRIEGENALKRIGVVFTQVETDNYGYKPTEKSCKIITKEIEKNSNILDYKVVENAMMACVSRPKGILRTQELINQKGYSLKSECIDLLRRELKDPGSLQVLSHRFLRETMDNNKLGIRIDYTAKNSFGGRVRDTYECSKG